MTAERFPSRSTTTALSAIIHYHPILSIKSRTMILRSLAIVTLFLTTSLPLGAAIPEAATVLDADVVWDIANPECFSISPDGKFVAYISRGAIWSCALADGPPIKLAELPHSVTAFLAMSGNEQLREQAAQMPPTPGYTPIRRPREHGIKLVFSLAWTPSQDGVVYTTRNSLKENSTLAAFKVMHASLNRVVKEIATIEREYVVYYESGTNFRVSRDRKYVVLTNYGSPLIWDVLADRPRATCFDYLTPAKSSEKWLGIEIDTRQLVLADGDFRILKRFDVRIPQRRQCQLVWSPDERFAVALTHSAHPSDKTTGIRIDLQTGAKTQLATGVIRDRYYFTSDGGELVRLGITGFPPNGFGDGGHGAYITVLADDANNDENQEQEIVRFPGPPRKPKIWRNKKPYPPILGSTDGSLFAIALPRPTAQAAGFHYHLVDRSGATWPFLPVSGSNYNSPFYPLAFINQGRSILAREGSHLFTIPIASITESDSSD